MLDFTSQIHTACPNTDARLLSHFEVIHESKTALGLPETKPQRNVAARSKRDDMQ